MGICRIWPCLAAQVNGVEVVSTRTCDLPADEAQSGIAHERAWEQARLAQNLKAVAYAQHRSARLREPRHGAHHRRKAGDGSGAQVIAIRKAAGQQDGVKAGNVLRLMPDEFRRLVQDFVDGVKSVVIAVRSGKDDNTNLHPLQLLGEL